ncbi:type III pantothenate kinase [Wenzhouxiangella sp. XN24]|uniref:type III pantothenate kinase n=1 Tax=Wenzhouxiangella sp. XN24 TaxID=2713569 RepID=UPI0013EBDC39|nr:type III pantothenate kinase [Wenzhouxiangella sp. XN24]NGX15936.1 type III pantothenate kinase [Wenzhouxiangella sp. XN24]
MMLLLDLGNTRLKAGWPLPGGGVRVLGEASHRDRGMREALAGLLDGTDLEGRPALCANVAGAAAGKSLADALRESGGGSLAFLRAEREFGGVSCGYRDPSHLGADRWAALLGARVLSDEACLVVDAGSALTLDALAPGGRHLGGWILPGLSMMVAALEARTGDLGKLRRASGVAGAGEFPADTGPAMESGARLAAVGAVRGARDRLERHCGRTARLLLTGGDAAALVEAVADARHVPDLVLQGLARAATARLS